MSALLWPPCVADADIIFILWFLLSSAFFFFLFLPRLTSAVADWMSTIRAHMLWPYCEFKMQVCAAPGSLHTEDAKSRQKIAIWAPSHNFVGLYLATKACIDNRKKLAKQQYLLHMFPQYGELQPTSG